MPYGYGEDEGGKSEEEKTERRQALMAMRDDFRHVFTTPQGERAITYLYNFCNQGGTTFSQNASEAAYREGMRRVYLQIAGFVQMTDERIYELFQSQSRERNT